MKISFHGATNEVTGSCYLLQVKNIKILIDCGLFQGEARIGDKNLRSFGFNPKEINFLLLTHAHLDHCGRIPLLYKQGFRGKIITTSATKELTKIVLLDSAKIHEEDFRHRQKHLKRHSKNKKKHGQELYNALDVLNCLDHFDNPIKYNKTFHLSSDIKVTFFDAGHILGSASVFLEIRENNNIKTITFSGDIGCKNKPIIRDPASLPNSDFIVMETTYGNRNHRSLNNSLEEFYSAINSTINNNGNVYIPTFALERAQELLFFIREGIENKKIPKNTSVYLDSPMAISATEIYKRHTECFDEETVKLFKSKKDPFNFQNVHFIRDVSQSISLNNIKSGAIIMAGAGMCNGGRICQHLKHNIWRDECSVVFVSFAAEGTLARKIIDGAKTINLYGEKIDVKAKVYTINGFSAHAGKNELLSWYKQFKNPKCTFLVHGSPESTTSIESEIKKNKCKVLIPKLYEPFEI